MENTSEFECNASVICSTCGKETECRQQHEIMCRTDDEQFKYLCGKCGMDFSSPDIRKRHEEWCKEKYEGLCTFCGHQFNNIHNLQRHEEACNGDPPRKRQRKEPPLAHLLSTKPNGANIIEYETAFRDRLKSFFIRSNENFDLPSFLNNVQSVMYNKIKECVIEHGAIKINVHVDCLMKNQLGEELEASFKTKNMAILHDTNVTSVILEKFEKIKKELEETQLKKSGWTLNAVDGLRLRVNKYNPLRGSTYIQLPKQIENTMGCVNVQNKDNHCFKYAILSKFVLKNAHRPSKYKKLKHTYDFSCISFPTPLEDIKKFERCNNISINVFGLDKKCNIYPLKIIDDEKVDHRDLLLISNDETQHYVYIKNFERLVGQQLSHHREHKMICKRCFHHFDSRYDGEQRMDDHREWCAKYRPARVELPKEKPYVEFEHVERCLRVPYVIYCDFECLLPPVENCKPDPTDKYTVPIQKHEAMSFCAYLKKSDNIVEVDETLPDEPYLYRGKDAPAHLMNYLRQLAEKISEIYQLKTSMKQLSEDEQHYFSTSTNCYMCEKEFTPQDYKVHDHCHITGHFRGAAHNSCNLRYQTPKFIPVLFHNLSGYDSHFIIRELDYDDKQIDIIPNTEEKYISFSKTINKFIKLRFLDTYRFMPSSLDSLAKNIPNLVEVKKFFQPHQIPLLTRKGVFPYEYVTSWDKLNNTCLPSKEQFYSHLSRSGISDDDYEHACNVWNMFNITNLGEYSDHYLKTDVLLLADIFENFRTITMNTHKMDPCHFYTLPGLSWSAMLRFTQIKLELLQDYEMVMMVERGVRGGLCQVSHRLIKANNKHMKNFNDDEESVYIAYQDCNNLYGLAMVKPLPYGDFQWVDPNDIIIKEFNESDKYGFILDVDIEYPSSIHPFHNDLPFLPENITVTSKQTKLCAHLMDRNRYVVHSIALKQALEHGLILKKIHRALRFKQSCWLQPYIEHNTKLRTQAQNSFEKDLFKLYNNAVFGKCLENVRNRMNMKLISGIKKIEKAIAKPEFIDRTIYSENLAAVHFARKKITFDKPIFVGMAVLELSKCAMYTYHYDVMLPKYGPERLKLAYMDTDSFIYRVKTKDLYEDMYDMCEYLDTSDYPSGHKCYSIVNKKVLGKFKDECNGKIIEAFVGLRSKMYSLKFDECEEVNKAKGVQRAALKQYITFEDYEACLKGKQVIRLPNTTIRSKQHTVHTVEINKLALSAADDKRIIMNDGITTLAIGYKAPM